MKMRHKKMARSAYRITGFWMTEEACSILFRWRNKFKSVH